MENQIDNQPQQQQQAQESAPTPMPRATPPEDQFRQGLVRSSTSCRSYRSKRWKAGSGDIKPRERTSPLHGGRDCPLPAAAYEIASASSIKHLTRLP